MARIIGNPTVTPMAVPDWNQTNEMRADFIKNRPLEAIKTAESLRYYGDANIVPSDASLFLFALDDTTMTASVKAKSNSISGDIVIPYKYIDGNKTYTVASLADSAFNNRDAITSITIPKSVESIGKNAVSYCDTIASITIPKSVTNIGDYGIFSCPPLTDIYYEGSKEDWAKISFGNEAIPDGAKIHYSWTSATQGYVDEKFAELEKNNGATDSPSNKIYDTLTFTNGVSIEVRGDEVYFVADNTEHGRVEVLLFSNVDGTSYAQYSEETQVAERAGSAEQDDNGNIIHETYATKKELSSPKEVIRLSNDMRIEARAEGIYLVSPEDREQEIEECHYLLISKDDARTDLIAKHAEFAYETEYALYAENSATADMDSEERTLKGVYIEELDLDEAIDISEIEIFDGYVISLGLVNRPMEILLPPEEQYQYVGFTSAMYFATPSEIPENYTKFPDVIYFRGDSVVDGRLVPEPNMRYTIVFDFDGYMLNGYVSGVTTV